MTEDVDAIKVKLGGEPLDLGSLTTQIVPFPMGRGLIQAEARIAELEAVIRAALTLLDWNYSEVAGQAAKILRSASGFEGRKK